MSAPPASFRLGLTWPFAIDQTLNRSRRSGVTIKAKKPAYPAQRFPLQIESE